MHLYRMMSIERILFLLLSYLLQLSEGNNWCSHRKICLEYSKPLKPKWCCEKHHICGNTDGECILKSKIFMTIALIGSVFALDVYFYVSK
ncbi:hypothetical protein I4U23_027002 [Adineta vaga]|nr:hypothetical protein I4U23_027002 [Adineta vaga]